MLDACLKEIATALLQADVNVRLVANLRCGPAWGGLCRPPCDCVPCPASAGHLPASMPALRPSHCRNNVKKRVNMEQLASGLNKQKVIEKVGAGCMCVGGGVDCMGVRRP